MLSFNRYILSKQVRLSAFFRILIGGSLLSLIVLNSMAYDLSHLLTLIERSLSSANYFPNYITKYWIFIDKAGGVIPFLLEHFFIESIYLASLIVWYMMVSTYFNQYHLKMVKNEVLKNFDFIGKRDGKIYLENTGEGTIDAKTIEALKGEYFYIEKTFNIKKVDIDMENGLLILKEKVSDRDKRRDGRERGRK